MKNRNIASTRIILFAFSCFAFSAIAQAISPAPDGGYPGGNTAEGQSALFSLTTGSYNTAIGLLSLRSNAQGSFNTGLGAGALLANVGDPSTRVGEQNTAVGAGALLSNTTGSQNVANGAFALFSNTDGGGNSAFGCTALASNTTGGGNTAAGEFALSSNISGSGNTALGDSALWSNTGGSGNTAVGLGAGGNVSGSSNTAVGTGALQHNVSGSSNTAVGADAGGAIVTANGVIAIGHPGVDVSFTTWIGNIYGVTTQSGFTAPVIVSDGGQLGTVASSERFKKDITSMDQTSEAVLSLRPVTFHYKADTKCTPQFGLIAEEVAKMNPALVLPDKEGKPYTVRYDAVNAMLLNEFLKEHRKVEKLEATAAEQQKQLQTLLAQLNEQAAQLQKIGSLLQKSHPAPQLVQSR